MRGALASLATALALGAPAQAAELGELFRTPEQRASARLAAGEHEALIENAPDARWEGFGRYAAGDHAGAAEAFARALDEAGTGGALAASERDALRFERATAATRAGALDEAIDLYEALLEDDSEHADARHNLEIARALRALEERAEGAGGADGEERGEPGESGDGQSGDADETPTGEDTEAAGDEVGDGRDDEAEAEVEDEAARAALSAEAEAGTTAQATAETVSGTDTPSEREQATEQWLRRIADDPAGLLRRRLQRSHRDDYPEVGDGAEPW